VYIESKPLVERKLYIKRSIIYNVCLPAYGTSLIAVVTIRIKIDEKEKEKNLSTIHIS